MTARAPYRGQIHRHSPCHMVHPYGDFLVGQNEAGLARRLGDTVRGPLDVAPGGGIDRGQLLGA